MDRWGLAEDTSPAAGSFVFDRGDDADGLMGRRVVASAADGARIDALLAAGALQVLIGEAALRDAGLVAAAIERHGPERIGIWLRVRLAETRWALDRESNADFSFVSIASPVRRWLVLRADNSLTDVDALWWAGEMLQAGCAAILVSVSAPQDDDLLPCAEMAEVAGERFWLDAGSADVAELRFWVKYGQARQLVLPRHSDLDQAMAGLNARLTHEGRAV